VPIIIEEEEVKMIEDTVGRDEKYASERDEGE
jgi:hypothetical protein